MGLGKAVKFQGAQMCTLSRWGWALAAVLSMQGCQSIGVGSVQRDRMDYGGAIADSWKEQTLLNIVKLRYFDTPTFLEVSTVISSYQLQSEVNFAREIFPNAPGDTNRSFGLSGTYTDRPTISYAPLTGEKFVGSLLRPIPPQAVFAMILSGHQADFIMRATVRAINDIYNHSASPSRARREDPAFSQVISALRRIQQAGALGMRIEVQPIAASATAGGARGERWTRADTTWVFFRENADPETARDIAFVREALGIDPAVRELRLSFGSLRSGGGEIALLTRSIMEILVELSAGIDVPAQHLSEGRARPSFDAAEERGPHPATFARIRSGSEQPQDAYVAVRYRNYWFWVDDRDLASKRAFSFLRIFSSIAETGVAPQLPVLTIPAN
jgi:hypothetical protein